MMLGRLRAALANAATSVVAAVLIAYAVAKGWTTGQKPERR